MYSLVLLAFVAAAAAPAASLHLRLETALTSYGSKVGDRFRTVVIAPYERDGRVLLPAGTTVFGTVFRAKAVGMGFVRERASLGVKFDEYELPEGRRFPFAARLRRVDNARETVNAKGEIKGILAANYPQSLVGGVWLSPNPARITRSFIGLTGATGRLVQEYSMGPIGAAVVVGIRCALFKLPEPEIRLPAGAELRASVENIAEDAPTFDPAPETPVPADVADWLRARPVGVDHPSGMTVADIINVALLGSRADIVRAFVHAGWVEAEPLGKASISRAYRAYSGQSGYAAAPVSKLLYLNNEADLVFEKSLNTLSKRHHIRIWKTGDDEVWLAAATHDVRVAFENGSITHQIDPWLDVERAKIGNDLAFTACAGPAGYVDRPSAAQTGKQRDAVRTDGRLAVISLRGTCTGVPAPTAVELPNPPRTRAARLVRRMILEGRQYALRGHPYYWGYRFATMASAHRREARLDD